MGTSRLLGRLAAAGLLLTGPVGIAAAGEPAQPDRADAASSGYPRGQHPWPRGDEWPQGLQGPFERLAPEPLAITSWDGTVLRGTLWRPAVPAGVRLPVVLHSSPYPGNLDASPDDPNEGGLVDDPEDGESREQVPHSPRPRPVPVDLLVRAGYAVALVNVRGTGESGGCFDYYGADEQRDQPALVAWLAAQAWSNGRVGMTGQSYDGTTPLQAAVAAPDALKTVVPLDPGIDYYVNGVATPQSAMLPVFSAANEPGNIAVLTPPPVNRTGSGQPASSARYLLGGGTDPRHGPAAERACPDVLLHAAGSGREPLVDERDSDYYLERRLTSRLPRVTAAVLGVMGLRDMTQQNFGFDAVGWELMDQAPKHLVLGQWDHCGSLLLDGWEDLLLRWLDFWLKGLGHPPAELGTVRYQVNSDSDFGTCTIQDFSADADGWSTARAWPPSRTPEVLYGGNGSLSPTVQAAGTVGFRASPRTDVGTAFCGSGEDAVAYLSAPTETDTVLAGSPVALLDLASDGPAGLVTVTLFQVSGDPCDGGAVRLLSRGIADLQFHRTQFVAEPFTDAAVRVDLANVAERLREGDRLGVVLSGPDPLHYGGAVATGHPHVLVGSAGRSGTQIALPVADGSLGGKQPRTAYPGRPDLPLRAPAGRRG